MALEKQFVPTDPTVEQVLTKTNRLIVPRFQRLYSWKEDNLNEFYEDFLSPASYSRQNFLGTLVFDASKPGVKQVIDGQQRIITLTVVFAVLRDLLQEDIKTQSAIALATSLHNEFILSGSSIRQRPSGDADSGGSMYIFTAEKSMRAFFEHFISKGDKDLRQLANPKNEGEKNLQKAYNYLRGRINKDKLSSSTSYDTKVEIIRKIAESLMSIQFILIDVYNSDMAYALFESHNAKGADLLVSDLVKSHFYGQLRGPDETKERHIKKWDNSVKKLKDGAGIKIDKFLHYYQQSYEGKFTKAQLYSQVKSRIGREESSALQFIADLEVNVDLLLKLKTGELESSNESPIPYETKEKINNALSYISDFGVDQCYILLLSVFRNRQKFTPTYLKKIVELIENFTYVYSKISKGQANVLEKIYAQLAKDIEKDENPESEKEREIYSGRKYSQLRQLLSKEVQYDYFEPKFKDLDYTKPKQKKLIKYTFAKIENHLNNGGSILGIDSNLDHVSAQNPSNGLRLKNMHSIGNLVPIDKLSNSTLGNKPVEDKVDTYREIHNITLVRELVNFLESRDCQMDDDAIDDRAANLAKIAYDEVWKI